MKNKRSVLAVIMLLTFAVTGAEIFREDFNDPTADWEIVNHLEKLSIDVGEVSSECALRIRMTNENCDTAWKMESRAFPVQSGEGIELRIRAKGETSTDVATLTSRYSSRIRFFSRKGSKVVRELPFGYSCAPNEWRETVWRGTVPSGADSARIQIGLDSPNVKKDTAGISISSIVLSNMTAKVERWSKVPRKREVMKASDGRMCVRADGMAMVDGKPFFPLGLYSVRPCAVNGGDVDAAMAEIKQKGFNFAHTYAAPGAEREAFFNAADKYGVRVMVAPGNDANAKSVPDSEEAVAYGRKRQSLLAWYIGVDTSGHQTGDGAYSRRRRLREMDATHLTAQADSAWADSYGPFVHCTDIFLPEIYPVKKKEVAGTEVAEVAKDMAIVKNNIRDGGDAQKCVWAALQQFAGWSDWRRFPSREELWATAYAAIIHGARGLVWYTYAGSKRGRGAKDDPEKWRELCELVLELSQRMDVLVAPDSREQPSVIVAEGPSRDALRQPSVSCLLKDAPNGKFLLAVNSATNAVRAYIGVKAGGMMVNLPPYGVYAGAFKPVVRNEWRIGDFGARDDGKVHTRSIQCAIEAARIAGGGTVVVPKGTFISGALFFRRGVNLRIDRGGILKGSTEILDYPLMKTRIEGESCLYFPALVNSDRNDGFTVSGEGTIDGSGEAYWKRLIWRSQWYRGAENKDEQRPRLLYVSNSRNVRVSGLTLKNSAFWTTHFYRCEDVELCDLRIFTEVIDGVRGQNPDAVDLDGVKRVRIRRVYMDVPNDAVTAKGGKGPDVHDPGKSPESAKVEDVIIEDCTFGPQCTGGLTLGSECFYAKNLTVRSCKVENPTCVLRLKMRPDTKQEYGQIHVSDISGSCAYALIVKAYTAHARPEWKGLHIPSKVKDVRVDIGSLKCLKGPSVIVNDPDYTMENVICK